MKTTLRLPIFFILLIAVLPVIATAYQKNSPVTKEQAVKLAEQFLVDNGYTSKPGDEAKMNYELLDEGDKEKILKRRHGSLQPKAFCFSERKEGWDIGFLATSVNLDSLDNESRQTNLPGRAVFVNKNGKEVRIMHKMPLFSMFTKL